MQRRIIQNPPTDHETRRSGLDVPSLWAQYVCVSGSIGRSLEPCDGAALGPRLHLAGKSRGLDLLRSRGIDPTV